MNRLKKLYNNSNQKFLIGFIVSFIFTTTSLIIFIKSQFDGVPIAFTEKYTFPKLDDTNYADIKKLPDGGKFYKNPIKKSESYYLIKAEALYRTQDSGKTWKRFNSGFCFVSLFIHPDTGILFAFVPDDWYETNKWGFLQPRRNIKFIRSSDGTHWKDITPKERINGMCFEMFADPDNRGRICVEFNSVRGYILQSMDENYSEWICERELDWKRARGIKIEL